MAVRDLFAAVDRPAPPPPKVETRDGFDVRWSALKSVVAEKWGQEKLYWLEQKLAWLHKFREASLLASNGAYAAALDDLRAVNDCPHNIPSWMASAIERAIAAEKHQPTEHVAHDGHVQGRRHRAYERIARRAGTGEP